MTAGATTRIMGIDPGLTRCGAGVIERSGRGFALCHVEVVRTDAQQDVSLRVHRVSQRLAELMDRFKPAAVSVERVFAQHNLHTVMGIGHVIGAAMVLAGDRGIPLVLHTPSEVKAAVSGYGAADKEQVQRMVARMLGVAQIPGPPDAADALAIALCQAARPVLSSDAAAVGETPAQRQWRLARGNMSRR